MKFTRWIVPGLSLATSAGSLLLGALGLSSAASAAGAMVSIGLLVVGTGGLLPSTRLRAAALAWNQLVLLALAAYHIHGVWVLRERDCGCLHRFGNPSRFVILAVVSALLLFSVAGVGRDLTAPREPLRRMVAVVGALLLGGLASWWAAPAPAPPLDLGEIALSPTERTTAPSAVLRGVEGGAPAARAAERDPTPMAEPGREGWTIVARGGGITGSERFCAVLSTRSAVACQPAPESPRTDGVAVRVAGPAKPVRLTMERMGHPVTSAPIRWIGNGESREGEADFPDVTGRTVRGLVVDGRGAPVGGCQVLLSDADYVRRWGTVEGRSRAVAVERRVAAIAVSAEDGTVSVDGWSAPNVVAFPAQLPWVKIGVDADGDAAGARDMDFRLSVGRLFISGVVLRSPVAGVDLASSSISVVSAAMELPPVNSVQFNPLLGDPEVPLGAGVRVVSMRVVVDGSVRRGADVWPAGSVVFFGAGIRPERAGVVWSEAEDPRWTEIVVEPSTSGPAREVRFQLDPPLPPVFRGGWIDASIEGDGDPSAARVRATVGPDGRDVSIPGQVFPNGFTIRSPVFRDGRELYVAGGDIGEVRVVPRRTDLAVLRIAIAAPDGATQRDVRIQLSKIPVPGSGVADVLTTNTIIGLRPVLSNQTDGGFAYAFDLRGASQATATLRVGGPEFRTETRQISVERGADTEVSIDLARTDPSWGR